MVLHRDVDPQVRIVVPRRQLRHADGFRVFDGEFVHRHVADVIPDAVHLHFVADDQCGHLPVFRVVPRVAFREEVADRREIVDAFGRRRVEARQRHVRRLLRARMLENRIFRVGVREHDEHGDAAAVEFLQLPVEALHGAFVDHVRPSVELVHDGVFRIVRPQMADGQVRMDVLRAEVRRVLHVDDAADAFDFLRAEQRPLITDVLCIHLHDMERLRHGAIVQIQNLP